jgi:hypothetical protein
MKEKEIFVLFLGDMHVGSYWGIWHPDCVMTKGAGLEEGSTWTLNSFQKRLWEDWNDLAKWLQDRPPNIVVSLADLIDGAASKRWGGELVTDKAEIQIDSCLMLLRMLPVAKGCEFYGVASSPYHDIRFFSAMQHVTKGWPKVKGIYLGRTGIVDILGHKMRLYHGSSAAYVYREMLRARSRMFAAESMQRGLTPEFEAVVNGHWHNWMHIETSWKHGKTFHLVQIPCWQAQTDYMAWRDPDKLVPDIGIVTATVTKDELTFDKRLYPTPFGISTPVKARSA